MSSSPTGNSQSSSSIMHTPTPHLLTTPVNVKLDEHNFMVWQHQVMATIDGLRFRKYLEGKEAPPKYLNEESRASDIINPQYVHYHQQDRLIFAWLLSSMSSPLLTKTVGLNTSYEVWQKLKIYYASQSRAKIKKLKTQLKSAKKERSISVYILEIKKIVDSLCAAGVSISEEEHIEHILDGLSEEYDPFVTTILSCHEPYTVEEIEALLLDQEERLERHQQVNSSP